MSSDSSSPSRSSAAGRAALALSPRRTVRSAVFFLFFFLQATLLIGLGQRLFIYPAVALFPRRRHTIMAWWLRLHARITVFLAQRVGGVRVKLRGALPFESCVVLMNHTSVFDIPLAVWLVKGPQAVIPTRDRYRRWIPGISGIARLGRFPFLAQKRYASRAELEALRVATDDVARGDTTLIIYPEGHRSRDGSLGHFMRSGLRLILPRAGRPVYCVVADGMGHARTARDAVRSFAESELRVAVTGPFHPPTDPAGIDAFIDEMHDHMAATLDELRDHDPAPRAAHSVAAR